MKIEIVKTTSDNNFGRFVPNVYVAIWNKENGKIKILESASTRKKLTEKLAFAVVEYMIDQGESE